MFFSAAINPCYFNGFLTYIPLFSAADFATFLCASRLIVTPASYGYAIWYFTRSGTGSFRRDSAGSYRPTQASGFHGWERPSDWQIPSLHAPPGAAAFYVPAHRGCLSSVSSVAFGAVYFAGAASKGIPAHYPQVTRLSPDCGEASQGSGLSCRQRGAIPHAPKCGAVIRPAACVLPAAGGEPPGGFGGNMERECRDTWTIPLHPPL